MNRFYLPIYDVLVMVDRNLVKYVRIPQLLVFSTIQPVVFLLLFAYVFGGAIDIPGVDYINFLIPGIFVQTVLFGSIQTGVGLADDLSKGMIERFRSMPMSRGAVLAGRTISDLMRNIFVVMIMILVGNLIGFRFEDGITNGLFAIGIAVLMGFAFSWLSATIGLLVKNAESTQVASFIWVFPLVFASSLFVPIETMPDLLQSFAKHSPVTYTVDAVRALSLGLPIDNSITASLIWVAVILAVFVPTAIMFYRRAE